MHNGISMNPHDKQHVKQLTYAANLRLHSPCRKEICRNSAIYTTANFNISKLSTLHFWIRFFLSAYAMLHYQVSCMSHKKGIPHIPITTKNAINLHLLINQECMKYSTTVQEDLLARTLFWRLAICSIFRQYLKRQQNIYGMIH